MSPAPVLLTQPSTLRQDWSSELAATRRPTLNEAFPFMSPGWKAERAGCGYAMISPRVAAEHRRAENGD